MLDVEFAQFSDPGCIRDHNEDYLGCAPPQSEDEARTHGWLFALADGVGGQQRGEVASSIAVEKLLTGFRDAVPGEPYTTLLPRLVQAANTQIFEAGLASGPSGTSMATTIVACALRYDRAIVAHVGDSRCYLIRQQYAVSVTRDHTVSSEQQRLGLVSSREAEAGATSHLLSRALGNEMFVSVDTSEHQIFPGDLLLLCSDGLHHSVSTDDIVALTNKVTDLSEAAAGLVALAKERDGSDNISVQLVRVRAVERVGMYRGRHYKIQ
ncbi:MAG: serine/threonine-protein phosphatase [Acidobacteriaceae bacterium]|nr:serine/threonine-protein phosphatase [Acidobacteriaceae bacterium]